MVSSPLGEGTAVLADAVDQLSPRAVVRWRETSAVGLKLLEGGGGWWRLAIGISHDAACYILTRTHHDFSVRGGLRRCCSPTTTSALEVVDV